MIDGTANVELGEGLQLITIRVRKEDEVLVRGILIGYDGIASAHGDESGVLALVATESTLGELEAFLESLPPGLILERISPR